MAASQILEVERDHAGGTRMAGTEALGSGAHSSRRGVIPGCPGEGVFLIIMWEPSAAVKIRMS
jgi:hypothetical protein